MTYREMAGMIFALLGVGTIAGWDPREPLTDKMVRVALCIFGIGLAFLFCE